MSSMPGSRCGPPLVALGLCFVAAALFFFAPSPSHAFPALCVHIADGDTVTVLTDTHDQIKIRLYGIDAPERGQPFGARAKDVMGELCGNQAVEVQEMDVDRYGRTVAVLRPAGRGQSLNHAMIQQGLAWVYPKYCRADFCDAWRELEDEAREGGVGLWAAGAVPPWEWRRGRKGNAQSESIGKSPK